MVPKSLFASKTFWWNAIAGFAQIIPMVSQFIPQPYGIAVQSVVNIILRLITNQPVTVA